MHSKCVFPQRKKAAAYSDAMVCIYLGWEIINMMGSYQQLFNLPICPHFSKDWGMNTSTNELYVLVSISKRCTFAFFKVSEIPFERIYCDLNNMKWQAVLGIYDKKGSFVCTYVKSTGGPTIWVCTYLVRSLLGIQDKKLFWSFVAMQCFFTLSRKRKLASLANRSF